MLTLLCNSSVYIKITAQAVVVTPLNMQMADMMMIQPNNTAPEAAGATGNKRHGMRMAAEAGGTGAAMRRLNSRMMTEGEAKESITAQGVMKKLAVLEAGVTGTKLGRKRWMSMMTETGAALGGTAISETPLTSAAGAAFCH